MEDHGLLEKVPDMLAKDDAQKVEIARLERQHALYQLKIIELNGEIVKLQAEVADLLANGNWKL